MGSALGFLGSAIRSTLISAIENTSPTPEDEHQSSTQEGCPQHQLQHGQPVGSVIDSRTGTITTTTTANLQASTSPDRDWDDWDDTATDAGNTNNIVNSRFTSNQSSQPMS